MMIDELTEWLEHEISILPPVVVDPEDRAFQADASEALEKLRDAVSYAIDPQACRFFASLVADPFNKGSFEDVRMPHDNFFIQFDAMAWFPFLKERSREDWSDTTNWVEGLHFYREDDEMWVSSYRTAFEGEASSDRFGLSNITFPLSAVRQDMARLLDKGAIFDHPVGIGKLFALQNGLSPRERGEEPSPGGVVQHSEVVSGAFWHYVERAAIAIPFLHFLSNEDRETVSVRAVDVTKSNRKREKKGKTLHRPYSVMRLGDLGRAHLEVASAPSGEGVRRRAHLVRGHLMRSHGKLVWRRPHVRGVGEVEPSRIQVKL